LPAPAQVAVDYRPHHIKGAIKTTRHKLRIVLFVKYIVRHRFSFSSMGYPPPVIQKSVFRIFFPFRRGRQLPRAFLQGRTLASAIPGEAGAETGLCTINPIFEGVFVQNEDFLCRTIHSYNLPL
jgi:hypothetical protein